MIKAALIDVDNTLLDFNECAKQSMKKGFEMYGLPFNRDDYAVFMRINNHLWEEIERGNLSKEELLQMRWNLIFKELGIEEDGPAFERVFRSSIADSHCLVEGARELMEYLSAKYRVFFATNGFTRPQKNRLELAGLWPFAEDMFVSESIGCNKPERGFFDYCFARMGDIGKDEVIMIGDSLTADIEGAADYGIHTLWYNHSCVTPGSAVKPDYTVNKLEEIRHIL